MRPKREPRFQSSIELSTRRSQRRLGGLLAVPLCFALWLLAGSAGLCASAAPDRTGYVGSDTCKTCHPNVWLNFPRNPHFKSIAAGNLPPEKVGCEGCHGPGQAHVAAHGGKATIKAFSTMTPRQVIDRANNVKLLRELAAVTDSRRTARFVCHLAMADQQQTLIEATDSIEGVIGHQARGDGGFGYDPLFYLPDRGLSTAELPADEKNLISHRGKALRKFAPLLNDYLTKAAPGAEAEKKERTSNSEH